MTNESFPLVSVLVPTYNEEIFIHACVESILSQDYPNFEVIVFDDCSTDKTASILETIVDPRFKLIKNPINEKHEKTWNYLLTIAKGKYIKTVCGDDLLSPSCLSESVKALEKRPECVMAFCAKWIIDPQGDVFYSPLKEESYLNSMNSWELMRVGLLKGTTLVGEPNNVLFRSSVVKEGVRYHFSNYWMVDPDFYIQLAKLGEFVYVPQKLTSLRISIKSWSVVNSYKQASSFMKYIRREEIRIYFNFTSWDYFICLVNSYKLQTIRQLIYLYIIVKSKIIRSKA